MFTVEGIVETGDRRGRALGFPTANIPMTSEDLDGVWAGTVEVSPGNFAAAVVSVGRRRTFYSDQGKRLLEAHLLDLNMDLYGQHLRVHLMQLLRRQSEFESVQALVEQLHEDVRLARHWALRNCPSLTSSALQEPLTEARA
ncbi:riboflavin kinase [Arthrobacter sp. Z4-13]